MIKKTISSAAAFARFCALAFVCAFTHCANDKKAPSGANIVDEVNRIMAERFYDRSKLPDFFAGMEAVKNDTHNVHAGINRLFDELNVSHLGLYTPDDFEYYELLDVFKPMLAEKLKTIFPPDGVVRYPGIGVAPRLIDGRYHVSFIYANTPAANADILIGDELLTVDGQGYSPVSAFKGKVGQTVKLTLRRVKDGSVLEREVEVAALNPSETFIASTENSVKIIERDGHKIGYIRMYSYAGEQFGKILVDTLSGANFSQVDALIFDMRGRLGGAPLDAAEIFIGGTPTVEFVTATGETGKNNFRWTKPLVAVIGPETRSGLEIMAYALRKAGIPMVGSNTRGAVTGGAPSILDDGSFLFIPAVDAVVDGRRIEGVGVAPTVPVEAVLEYSQGHDASLEAAIGRAVEIIIEETDKLNFTETGGGVNVDMIFVKGGAFTMGCTPEQGGECDSDERPARNVTVGDFSIGKHEVTQRQWKAIMGENNNPSNFKVDDLPVENVSWNDVQTFIAVLNSKTGKTYRLPTEAEWEYAARGGSRSKGFMYSGSNSIDEVAWYGNNNSNQTKPVGTKLANELGIHDMSGNVWEWVNDWYDDYEAGAVTNPQGPASGSSRVYRGGSWSSVAEYCRVSNRGGINPVFRYDLFGFRLAVSP